MRSLKIMVVGLLACVSLHAGQYTMLNRTGDPVLVEIVGSDGIKNSVTVQPSSWKKSVYSTGTTLPYEGLQPRQVTLTNTRTKKQNVYKKTTWAMKPGGGYVLIRKGLRGKPRFALTTAEIFNSILRGINSAV